MSRIDEIAKYRTKDEMYEIGKEYLDGMDGVYDDGTDAVVQMPTTALKYFTKAAEQGHVEAQFELGCMYENGIGSEMDIEKAIEWYSSAASFHHPDADCALKRLAMSGIDERSEKRANEMMNDELYEKLRSGELPKIS
jgi:TPR repeat protein